ncbi:hypothetical protein H257_17855 [Aphanomyces astaci]|uniref:Uncharacterized protein n=1 Tax=Aphanomyces astaci TaxID=112090 RepID=W4FES9_APHAT|nr:hypothetical protein H257_17855 [Aphanomyces astaci]ETV65394.1 hypothetical protein H257_17855 [Aphanomyces astaci]|eukprot:XP_009845109.1 hypothetical protein H257_17855 [Aphanomyces astaci]
MTSCTPVRNGRKTWKFLRSALGAPTPPITIQSNIVRTTDDPSRYSSDREEVAAGLRHLLDNWAPLPRKPLALDISAQPWNLTASAFRTFSANGSSELWIAAPAYIRERERTNINLILRTGLVPPTLGRKQMIYLAKSATAQGVVNLDPDLPPWHPITVQSAFSNRIFTVIRDYISPCIPNEEMQQGFQRELLTSLLIERAERRQEELFLFPTIALNASIAS